MRIYLQTTQNTSIIPYDHQQKLVGVLHKWLGTNELHGKISLYSFSRLMNVVQVKDGLDFPNGAKMFISFYEVEYLKQIVATILDDPEMFCGLKVTNVTIEETPDLSKVNLFKVASPILAKWSAEEVCKHYTYDDAESGEIMKETLRKKMKIAGLEPDETLKIKFDTSFAKKQIKLIDYRGVKNRVNYCPIIMEAKPETKAFAWDVGLGSSTGIGFGAIY